MVRGEQLNHLTLELKAYQEFFAEATTKPISPIMMYIMTDSRGIAPYPRLSIRDVLVIKQAKASVLRARKNARALINIVRDERALKETSPDSKYLRLVQFDE